MASHPALCRAHVGRLALLVCSSGSVHSWVLVCNRGDEMKANIVRSFIKGLIWELTAPLVLYAFVREWEVCLGYFGARVLMFFLYVRLWKRIKWGK